MLFSDLRHDFVHTGIERLADVDFGRVEREYRAMAEDGLRAIRETAAAPNEILVHREADMRYVGQEHAVTVGIPEAMLAARDRAAIKKRFDDIHELRYGTCAPQEPAEIVSLRTTVIGVMAKPAFERIAAGSAEPDRAARRGTRKVFFREAGRFLETPIFARSGLKSNNRIPGPAVVEEHASTTVVFPDDALSVDNFGNLLISIGGQRG
jgi:N-methylhydantoinase A